MDKVRQGRSNRRKGKVGERAVANAFKARWPGLCRSARRGLQSRDGTEFSDVEGVPGLWIESKNKKKANVREALRQATESCEDGRLPLAVIKDFRKPPFVVLSLDHLFELLDGMSWRARDDETRGIGEVS